MSLPTCPLCQSRLRVMYFRQSLSVECVGLDLTTWKPCAFRLDEVDPDIIVAASMADHMRPLAEAHAYVAHPDYPGCDAPVGSPVKACGRAPECHPPAESQSAGDLSARVRALGTIREENGAIVCHPPAKACDCHKPLSVAGPWALCYGCLKRICPGCAEWFDNDMKCTGECHECAALSAAVVA